jgi:hypothetical protein
MIDEWLMETAKRKIFAARQVGPFLIRIGLYLPVVKVYV